MNKLKVEVIVPAAGSGERLGSKLPKPFVPILNQPLFIYSLKVFDASPLISSVILVIQEEFLAQYHDFIDKFALKKIKALVQGGEVRSASVANGIKALDQDTDVVLVHDAARPCINEAMVERVIQAAVQHGAATVGVPVKSTLKYVNKNGMVEETLDRSKIWEIQTPQGFDKDILIQAHASGREATDDAGLVEQQGKSVCVVCGDYQNIKVTTPEDLGIAESLLMVKGDEKN